MPASLDPRCHPIALASLRPALRALGLASLRPALRALGLASLLAACQPAAFPRTGEVAPEGNISAEVSLVPVVYEPQKVKLADGHGLRSGAAFFPMIHGGVRGSLGRCEIGGFYAMTRVGAEGRCALVQPAQGRPLALALSGAVGLDFGIVTAPVARAGLDASVELGPLIPILGLYLSTSRQLRYLEDPTVIPIDGPVPGSQSLVRTERRLTIPLALAIPVAYRELDGYPRKHSQRFSLVFGASPWFSLHSGPCLDEKCPAVRWDAEHGTVFSIGLDVR